MSIARHPSDRVFTASVGTGRRGVGNDWDARSRPHIYFARDSKQLRAGDHLFVLGAGRRSSVLGLYEVTGDGTSPMQNPWDDPRWPYGVEVRALASVPTADATRIPGLTAPRGNAHWIRNSGVIDALYAHVAQHEISEPDPAPSDDEHETPLRDPRPFDPARRPSPRVPSGVETSAAEREVLQEKAAQGHHELLARLHAWLGAHGFQDIVEIRSAIDLRAVSHDGHRVIFEAKTITEDNQLRQTRSGFAQLLEYRLMYGAPEDHLCLVCDQPPADGRVEIVDRLGVAVIAMPHDDLSPLGGRARHLLKLSS